MGQESSHSHYISYKCTCEQKAIITGTLHGQIGLWDLRHIQNGALKVIQSLIYSSFLCICLG